MLWENNNENDQFDFNDFQQINIFTLHFLTIDHFHLNDFGQLTNDL